MKKLLGKGGGTMKQLLKAFSTSMDAQSIQLLKLLTRRGLFSKLGYFISLVVILLQSDQYILKLIILSNNVPVNKYFFDTLHASLHLY